MNLHFDLLANQPRRHRIAHLLDPDRAVLGHRAIDLLIFAQAGSAAAVSSPPSPAPDFPAMAIGLLPAPCQKLVIVAFRVEIPAAAQEQMLLEPPLQMAVARLHVAVLVGTGNANGARGQTVMRANGNKLLVKRPFLSAADPVRRRRCFVYLQLAGTLPSRCRLSCRPCRNDNNDSDRQRVAHSQLEYGSTR